MAKKFSMKEYRKYSRREPNYGFVWIHPDVRESENSAKKYLRENPTHSVNLGDGKGWRYGKKWVHNDDTLKQTETKKKTKKKTTKRKRGKSINISGLTYEQKVKQIKKLLKKSFKKGLPDNVTFKRIDIRGGADKCNPDGQRILVHIDGLDGVQSNFDYKGKFRIDACINSIKEYGEK